MASLQFSPLSFGISLILLFLLFSSVRSLTCTSQKIYNNKIYSNCSDLPELGAYLHYTYNASNSSLSIAYIAKPPTADGWVAWAINPNGTGMLGAQALIAFKSNGTVTVNTYNLTSYGGIDQVSKLSFDVWDRAAEESNGSITIVASVKVPGTGDKLNQVWQVGPVTDGKPAKHNISQANLNSKNILNLTASSQTDNGTANSSPNGNGTESGGKSGGASIFREGFGLGFYVCLFLFSVICINF